MINRSVEGNFEGVLDLCRFLSLVGWKGGGGRSGAEHRALGEELLRFSRKVWAV